MLSIRRVLFKLQRNSIYNKIVHFKVLQTETEHETEMSAHAPETASSYTRVRQ